MTITADGGRVEVPAPAIITAFADALALSVEDATCAIRDFLTAFDRAVTAMNDPVRVAGLEARYFVRGALDPAYRDPEMRDALITLICWPPAYDDGACDDDLILLTDTSRARIAAAFLRGWAAYRPQRVITGGDPRPVWHRAFDHIGVHVEVGIPATLSGDV